VSEKALVEEEVGMLFRAFQKHSVVYQTEIQSEKSLAQKYWNYFSLSVRILVT